MIKKILDTLYRRSELENLTHRKKDSKNRLYVELGQQTGPETFILEYQIRQGASAEIWKNSLENAIPEGFSENDRFYNFPGHTKDDLDTLIQDLKNVTVEINRIESHRQIPDLDQSDLRNSLNYLHLNFAHSHLVEQSINANNVTLMRDFNRIIHAIESYFNGRTKYYEEVGIPPCSIVMTFKNSFRTPIPEDCYQEYTLSYTFGTAYFNYAQVGKQIAEMYQNMDDLLEDEHIQPASFFSADTYFWFGPTLGHIAEIRYKKNIEEWFSQRKDRFNKLGFNWGDSKLSLGQVPVADLVERFEHRDRIKEYQKQLARFDIIKKIELA